MNQEQAEQLLSRYNAGNCTEEERAIVEQWYLQVPYEADAPEGTKILAAMQEVWEALPQARKQTRKIRLWLPIAVAAAVAAIVLGVWFFSTGHHPEENAAKKDLLANDIAPGKNTAIITLADGTAIQLSDAKSGVVIGTDKLVYNDGTNVSDPSVAKAIYSGSGKSGRGLDQPGSLPGGEMKDRMLTASTPKGGTYQVVLPDGSKVWLNAGSSLKFPSTFGRLKNREVELVGEAYFEVFKNKNQPFVVKSKDQEITVLGTHFNVNSYAYEADVKTTLLEGSVQIIRLQEPEKKTILKPGQQAVVSKQFLRIIPVDVDVATAWKNGKFLFRNEKLESILNRLAYWYDVEIIYQGKKPDMLMSGVIERKRQLSSVLNLIAATGKVKFKIEGRKVYVMN